MPIKTFIPRVAMFGREIFHLYEKHPLMCNSIAGGTVFFASELVVQVQTQHQADPTTPRFSWNEPFRSFRNVDWMRVMKIAALGTAEDAHSTHFFTPSYHQLLVRHPLSTSPLSTRSQYICSQYICSQHPFSTRSVSTPSHHPLPTFPLISLSVNINPLSQHPLSPSSY